MQRIMLHVAMMLQIHNIGCSTTKIAPDSTEIDAMFERWLLHYDKIYNLTEHVRRRAYFEANFAAMRRLQKVSPHAVYDIFADGAADSSADERAERTGGGVSTVEGLPSHPPIDASAAKLLLDEPIDWVARGAVTSPESQGRCGTCLDFSGTASVESAWKIAGHPLERLSVQQTVDCCGGGPGYCMQYIQAHGGLAREADYPLANHSDPSIHGCRSPCNVSAAAHKVATISSVSCLHGHDEEQIRALLDAGPVSVSIAAHWLNGYKRGIINCSAAGIDHAVLLVGHGHENGFAYWKLRNSWGPAFGEDGYFRFVRGNLCLRGACQAKAPSSEEMVESSVGA